MKVGVVGCGYWGPNLIRNLRQAPDCQLKVLCDASEARLNHMKRRPLAPRLPQIAKLRPQGRQGLTNDLHVEPKALVLRVLDI